VDSDTDIPSDPLNSEASITPFNDDPVPVPSYKSPFAPQPTGEFDAELFTIDPTVQLPAQSSFTDEELLNLLAGYNGFNVDCFVI
jgi:hypothetical protein